MTGTNNIYTTIAYDKKHIHFGGDISNYSFDGHSTMAEIADSIMSDLRFDEQCKKNALNRDRNKNYKKGVM